jgi:hypothetical protein
VDGEPRSATDQHADDGGATKVEKKNTLTHSTKRVAAAILTMVAFGTTVSAPFKWSLIIFPRW